MAVNIQNVSAAEPPLHRSLREIDSFFPSTCLRTPHADDAFKTKASLACSGGTLKSSVIIMSFLKRFINTLKRSLWLGLSRDTCNGEWRSDIGATPVSRASSSTFHSHRKTQRIKRIRAVVGAMHGYTTTRSMNQRSQAAQCAMHTC